jgi:MFS family permease
MPERTTPAARSCALRQTLRKALRRALPVDAVLARLLPAGDLLLDAVYRRLWASIFISSLGGQISLLAIPLTAAALLDASPTQMGWLTAMETLPFAVFSLPAGAWLDRVRKLPVYVGGEILLALAVGSVPLAWWLGELSMPWLYVVAFFIGFVYTTAGSAGQIVLTQIVPRERLVEAHAKNALATSAAEVAGPGAAGALIKLTGAPLALLADLVLLGASALVLRGIRVTEGPRHRSRFWPAVRAGLHFVAGNRLLVAMAMTVGAFQFCYQGALVVQILFATRLLGLSEHAVGLSYVALGAGTVLASLASHRLSRRIGPANALILGITASAAGWLELALAPAGGLGIACFVLMLFCFGSGAALLFVNFLALRQAVTPPAMLGRMTSTMRWLSLIPGVPGALVGGWVGEHLGLRATLALSGTLGLLTAALAYRHPVLRSLRQLPSPAQTAPAPSAGADHSMGPGSV